MKNHPNNLARDRKTPSSIHNLIGRICIVIAVLGCAAMSGMATGGNPVPNPGFENGTQGWIGTVNLFAPDRGVFREGAVSLRYVANKLDENAYFYCYVPLREQKNYRVSFWYKLKDFGLAPAGSATMHLSFNKEGGANGSVGEARLAVPVDGDGGDWREFSAEVRTPGGTAVCQLVPIAIKGARGTIWLDDVRVEEVVDAVEIKRTDAAPVIDGRLDDPCWRTAQPLESFYQVERAAAPALTPTVAYLAYDDTHLYIAFRNAEPSMKFLKCDAKERDGGVYADDCNEIFVAAPNGGKHQFIVNAGNVQWDGELYQKVPGDPYVARVEWNGPWQSAVSRGEKEWIVEVAIPFSTLRSQSAAGSCWHLNLARERHGGGKEFSQWNRMEGNFNNVDKFATLTFAENKGDLVRFAETIDPEPFVVKRKRPRFEELLGDEPGQYVVGGGASGAAIPAEYPKNVQEQYTPEKWKQEQANILAEFGEAGMFGPVFPWVEQHTGGMAGLKELNERYGMKFPFCFYISTLHKNATAQGAQFVHSETQFADVVDPKMVQVIQNYLVENLAKRKEILPYMAFIQGVDEPWNQTYDVFSMTMNSAHQPALAQVGKEIKREFGFGKYGLYDHYAVESATPETPFQRIAFCRWWNARFSGILKDQQAMINQHAPGLPFLASTLNATSSFGPNDITLISRGGDWIGADPYPTSAMAMSGRARALYHTGFTIKVLRDLAVDRRIFIWVQCFIYHGKAPSPAAIREWAAQSLKTGAEILDWYNGPPPSRYDIPETHKEMLRINKIVHGMKRLKLPEKTRTGIFWSTQTLFGTGDGAQHGGYTVYSILGEKLKSWFRFVGDTELELGLDDLARYRLLYVPTLKYSDAETGARLTAFVKKGGTLVLLDPEAFRWNIDGTPHPARGELVGNALGARRQADALLVSRDGSYGLAKDTKLPLTVVRHREDEGKIMAYDIEPPADAKVFAVYADGKPAGYQRRVGKGQVIYFAAQPFGNSELAVKESAWDQLCRGFAKEAGEKTELPIWDFMLPEKGGEVAVNYVVPPKAK